MRYVAIALALTAAALLAACGDSKKISQLEARVLDAAQRLRGKDFTARPGDRCRSCDVRKVCGSAKQ